MYFSYFKLINSVISFKSLKDTPEILHIIITKIAINAVITPVVTKTNLSVLSTFIDEIIFNKDIIPDITTSLIIPFCISSCSDFVLLLLLDFLIVLIYFVTFISLLSVF